MAAARRRRFAKLGQSTGRLADAHAVLAPALEGFAPTPEMPKIAEARRRCSNKCRAPGRSVRQARLTPLSTQAVPRRPSWGRRELLRRSGPFARPWVNDCYLRIGVRSPAASSSHGGNHQRAAGQARDWILILPRDHRRRPWASKGPGATEAETAREPIAASTPHRLDVMIARPFQGSPHVRSPATARPHVLFHRNRPTPVEGGRRRPRWNLHVLRRWTYRGRGWLPR
jgi:hypothetical protein